MQKFISIQSLNHWYAEAIRLFIHIHIGKQIEKAAVRINNEFTECSD